MITPRVLQVAMLSAPILGVVVGSQIGVAARRVSAATAIPAPVEVPALPPEKPRLDTVQTASAVYAASLRQAGHVSSPFYVVSNASAQAAIESEVDKSKKVEPPPTFHLTSILKAKEPVATINGKLRRAGERVEGPWVIQSIDPEAGTALMVAPGREPVLVRLR